MLIEYIESIEYIENIESPLPIIFCIKSSLLVGSSLFTRIRLVNSALPGPRCATALAVFSKQFLSTSKVNLQNWYNLSINGLVGKFTGLSPIFNGKITLVSG
jgi:hypothetical protein